MKYADIVSADVPQAEPLNPRQVLNDAGEFVFSLDDWRGWIVSWFSVAMRRPITRRRRR
jgi:hypothetical protein